LFINIVGKHKRKINNGNVMYVSPKKKGDYIMTLLNKLKTNE
jgi:hypothetical protein